MLKVMSKTFSIGFFFPFGCRIIFILFYFFSFIGSIKITYGKDALWLDYLYPCYAYVLQKPYSHIFMLKVMSKSFFLMLFLLLICMWGYVFK